ncbi:SAM-dependent methyltransferase [Saccharopolyspora erythraea]|uniref:SAM-dependent methyltransferase n=1 Tax=Saccharopolyspora erythraea TaxID=1836 RepID=UPI001BA6FC12|nr:SAM-dependent methyltransferase [Saccharopolyspora erythraea]QUH02403.1 SAM-dependent methyltransferase [Saccharopolyspora erythraea]
MTDPAGAVGRQASSGAWPDLVDVDTDEVSIARVYDYCLDGKDNFAVDRAAAQAMIEVVPETPLLAKANRCFLRAAVRHLVGEAGIRQILDIGSGLPTAGNVHEIAQEAASDVRVVYVDNDPIVLAHGRALLATDTRTAVIQGDLREADAVFDHPETRQLIDTTEPFAVLLGGILMHLEDEEDPEGVAAGIRDRLPAGGYLLVSNTCDTGEPRARELAKAFAENGMGNRCFRTWEEQIRYFDGLELVEPGLVPNNRWRPGPDVPDPDNPAHALHIGGLGRKP